MDKGKADLIVAAYEVILAWDLVCCDARYDQHTKVIDDLAGMSQLVTALAEWVRPHRGDDGTVDHLKGWPSGPSPSYGSETTSSVGGTSHLERLLRESPGIDDSALRKG